MSSTGSFRPYDTGPSASLNRSALRESASSTKMSMNSTRRKRIEALRDREHLKEHRSRLQGMLEQKLCAKYGTAARASSVNTTIKNLVGRFMAANPKVSEPQLVELEKAVRAAVDGAGGSSRPGSSAQRGGGGPSGSRGGSRGGAPGSAGGRGGPGGGGSRQGGARGAAKSGTVPVGLSSEWTLIDTFQAIENEESLRRDAVVARKQQQEFKATLDKQRTEVDAREGAEKVEDGAYLQEQQRLLSEWREQQDILRGTIMGRLLEEKQVREQQIQARKSAAQKKKDEAMTRELRTLELCSQEITRAKELDQDKRRNERARLKAVRIENEQVKFVRAKRAKAQADEDVRLMNEYKAKLDREEQERGQAFKDRLDRLDQASKRFAEEGAGKEKDDTDAKMEAIILRDAMKKEKSDIERERSDKAKVRDSARLMAQENKRMAMEKSLRHTTLAAKEAVWSTQFRAEGEDYQRQEMERRKNMLEKEKRHQVTLQAQIDVRAASRGVIDMSERERALNKATLERLQNDPELMAKIEHRLTAPLGGGKRSNVVKSATNLGFTPEA